jgi:hypothetical protein
MLRDKTVLLILNYFIMITLNLPSSHHTVWFVCICASRSNLPTQNIMLTILNALSLACAKSSICSMQSRLPNGLGRGSFEGIVRLRWILAENEGPSCLSTGWERKKLWSWKNTEGTSSIILMGCHWGRPPKSHIKLTGRSCLKRQCTHMGFDNELTMI